jgi:hypothetical protein
VGFHEVPWDSMRFRGIPWGSMRFYDIPVNQSVPTEANRDLTSYIEAAAVLYKKKQQADRQVARQDAKSVKDGEKAAKAEQRAAVRAQKQQEHNALNAQHSLQSSQRGKRLASQKATSKSKRQPGTACVQEVAEAAPAALPAPLTQSRTQTIKRPDKFCIDQKFCINVAHGFMAHMASWLTWLRSCKGLTLRVVARNDFR